MTLTWTLAALALSLGLFGLSILRDRRDRARLHTPLVPTWLLQFLAVTAALLMLAHLITLLTGQPFVGRLG